MAADTCSLIAPLSGPEGEVVSFRDQSLSDRLLVLPPVVLVELLSDPKLPGAVSELFKALPLLEISDGYWQRAGILRAKALSKNRKARLADSLIAQSCLSLNVPLLTPDRDLRAFATFPC